MPKKTAAAEVVYPELKVLEYRGDDAMTVPEMKKLLGWEVVPPGAGADKAPDLTDAEGNEVRLANNARNRPFDLAWAMELGYTVLNRHWADSRNGEGRTLNGETLVIGRYGNVLSGQHRGAGLVLAEQIRTGPEADRWRKLWPGPVTMECLVVVGVDEGAETIRTLDNTRPRTLADVLYSEKVAFASYKKRERAKLCSIMERAVWFIAQRVGLQFDPFARYQTNSVLLEFANRHPWVRACVEHVWKENQYGDREARPTKAPPKVARYVGLGAAAGLMYLMGHSGDDGAKWRSAAVRNEQRLDRSRRDVAKSFWTALADSSEITKERDGEDPMEAVRFAKRAGTSDYIFSSGEARGTADERTGVIVKAFLAYVAGAKITQNTVSLKYTKEEKKLNEVPVVGGIDLGKPKKPADDEVEEKPKARARGRADDGGHDEEDAEEVERLKAEVRQQGLDATRDGHSAEGNGENKAGGRSRRKPAPALISLSETEDDEEAE